MKRTLTAVVIREDEGFVALCPEVDVASQGATLEEAKRNLQEAVELFFECASPEEIQKRLSNESAICHHCLNESPSQVGMFAKY